MSQVNLCRLCVSLCDDYKSLYDESGLGNELYETTLKYFHPVIVDMDQWKLLTGICLQCWRHICDFHSFQTSILVAQLKLMADEHEVAIKAEVEDLRDPIGPSTSKALRNGFNLEAKEEFISLPAADNLDAVGKRISISDLIRINDGAAGFDPPTIIVKDENKFMTRAELNVIDVHGVNQGSSDEECRKEASNSSQGGYCEGTDSESATLSKEADKDWSELELTDSDPDDDFSSEDEVPLKRVKHKLTAAVHSTADFPVPEDNVLSSELELTDSDPDNDVCSVGENVNSSQEMTKTGMNSDVHDIMNTFGDKSKTKRENLDELLAKWLPVIKCVACPESYNTLAQLQNHFRQQHPMHKFYIFCCNRKLPVPTRLREHLLIHSDPEAFKCKLCARMYTLKSGLLGHMALRHPEAVEPKKYTCKKCHKSFDAARRLSFHVKVSHAVTEPREPRQRRRKRLRKSEIPPDGPNAFTCAECGKVFHKYRSFSQHQWYSHRLEPKHQCTICGKGFKLKYFLRKHVLIHTGYTCAFCPMTFRNIGELHAHRNANHPEQTAGHVKQCK